MKVCYFGIDENEDLSMFWDDYPEPKRDKTPIVFPDVDRSDEAWETKQDEFHCWQGARLPQWIY